MMRRPFETIRRPSRARLPWLLLRSTVWDAALVLLAVVLCLMLLGRLAP